MPRFGDGQTQTLPNHKEINRGTLYAIPCRFISEPELRPLFFTPTPPVGEENPANSVACPLMAGSLDYNTGGRITLASRGHLRRKAKNRPSSLQRRPEIIRSFFELPARV